MKFSERVNSTTILRKRFTDSDFQVVSPEVAFQDILASDRWGSDDYIEEEESLEAFESKCSGAYTERITERYIYKFINIKEVEQIIENNNSEKHDGIYYEDPNDFS